MVQKPTESAAEFAAALRELAKSCSFGQFLERSLRDRFVIGLAHAATRERLFARGEELTFQQAVTMATTAELASAHSRIVGSMAASPVVAQISGNKSPKPVRQRQSVTFDVPVKCDGCNGDHVR